MLSRKEKVKGSQASPKGRKRIKRIQPMPLEGLVVLEQILLHYPVGKTTIYKEIKEGIFPAQKARRGRSVFWDAVEVRKFLKRVGATVELLEICDEDEESGTAQLMPRDSGR